MINWRALTAHSAVWHLAFYLDFFGRTRTSRFLYRLIELIPGQSASSRRYKKLAAAKLGSLSNSVNRSNLDDEEQRLLEIIRNKSSIGMESSGLQNFDGNTSDLASNLWSMADLAEMRGDKQTATEIYVFLTGLSPETTQIVVACSLSYLRLGKPADAESLLLASISDDRFDKSSIRACLRGIGLLTGNLSLLLDPRSGTEAPSVDNEIQFTQAAEYVAREALTDFAMRLPSFLAQNPQETMILVAKITKKLRKMIFVFPFVEHVLVTMVRAGVEPSLIEVFRKNMKFVPLGQADKKRKDRVLDIAIQANFSYSFDYRFDFSPVWSRIENLSETRVPLENPLIELPSWTPWVGAFAQAPHIPLWKTNVRLIELAEKSWADLHFTASHIASPVEPQKRVRVGFLFHSSMPMISGLLAFFPKEEFECVFICPKGEALTDEAKKWIKAADATVEVSNRDLRDALETIAKLELDFLISGPSTSSLWFVSLTRLARIQAILIEPAWTDGSRNLDYYISWKNAEPTDFSAHYNSAVALLEHPPYWIEPSTVSTITSPQKKETVISNLLGLSKAHRTYLCASTIIKLHPEMDEVIEGILESDSSAVVVFLRGEHLGADALKARLKSKLGRNFERVVFLSTLSRENAHQLLQSVDCVFDSFPITGMSSSFDGLKNGVPIVTLESESTFGKWTSAIYAQIGVKGLATRTKSEFVDLCTQIAGSPDLRQEFAQQISSRVSTVLESEKSAAEFVSFIRSAWLRYLNGETPTHWINMSWDGNDRSGQLRRRDSL